MKTSEFLNPTPEYSAGTEFSNGDRLNFRMTSDAVNSERARALTDAALNAQSVEDFRTERPDIASVRPELPPTKPQLIGRNNQIVTAYRRNELDLAA